jgi:hypothetical protein
MEYIPHLEIASAVRASAQRPDFNNVVVGRRRPTLK